jgi:hypothetical protein
MMGVVLRRTVIALASFAAAIAVAAGAAPHAGASTPSALTCHSGYYKNVSGHCVHRPVKRSHVPAGATAKCRDGSYSFSEHASGTCSHHGGVAVWIHHP